MNHLYLRGIEAAAGWKFIGRAPALQAGCQEFESPILHNGLEYIRAHVSERKKNRNPTRVGEVGTLLVPPLLTSHEELGDIPLPL